MTTPRPPRIKICGLTGLDDAQRAVEAGAWALGLILFSGSPRRCPLPAAERISGALRRQAEICGVFVNAPLDEVTGVADAIEATHPYAVDTASGTEARPGVKDPEKLRAFAAAVAATAPELAQEPA